MYKIAICDDERYFRNEIYRRLEDYLKRNNIEYEIDIYTTGEELCELGEKIVNYLIVFLDINMKGMNGVDVAQRIRLYSEKIFIVFITAYIDYSIDGYKVGAVRYLLKNNENFQFAIEECMDAIDKKINTSREIRRFIFTEGPLEIMVEKIIYVESSLHRLEFHISGESGVKNMYGRLDELEEEFKENRFIRVHQSFLVNLMFVKKVSRYSVLLLTGESIPIPRARYRAVEEKYIAFKGRM